MWRTLYLIMPLIALWHPQLLWKLPYPSPPLATIPRAQRPTPASLDGPFAPNNGLLRSKQLFQGISKPETPAVLPNGTAYVASAATGQLLRSSIHHPNSLQHVAWLGHPLGMQMHPDGYLVVCDAAKGLLKVQPSSGEVTLLTSRLPNASLSAAEADVMLCDDLDVARDGRVFFSDASRIPPLRTPSGEWDSLGASKLSFLQGSPGGRLLVYDPRTRSTDLLADGIWFANGVALAEDESFVLVAETFGGRVLRHWLRGPAAGATEVFLDALPGFPDGISRAPGGATFWLAIVSTHTPQMLMLPHWSLLRWLAAWLPDALKPRPTHVGVVAEVSADGKVLRSFQDLEGTRCHTITSAVQVGSTLFMGSLATSHVCALELSSR